MAKGYWIDTYLSVSDPEKLNTYIKLARHAIVAGGGTFLTAAVATYAFEKGKIQRTVIIEFPSVDVAVETHGSPSYQEALKALDGGAERDVRIVEGLEG
jgi:uncharacterized protein (DUF1330 family)